MITDCPGTNPPFGLALTVVTLLVTLGSAALEIVGYFRRRRG